MSQFKKAFQLHKPLLIFGWLYGALIAVLGLYMGATADDFVGIMRYFIPASMTSFFFPVIMLPFCLFFAIKSEKPGERWLRRVINKFEGSLENYVRNGGLHNGLMTMLALFPVVSFFCIGKSMVPSLNTYHIDPLLARIDQFIHFGHYPHELLMPWIEKNGLAQAADNLYIGWFVVMYIMTEYCTWADTDGRRRMRLLWTYALSWIIIGNLMAISMASVGPIYFHLFYTDIASPYADLMQHLEIQNKLQPLKLYSTAGDLLGMVKDDKVINVNAISAMPSMHVVMAFLIFLYTRSINKYIAALALVYFFLILGASVYLGWHYAIDGYVGVLAVWFIWRFCGWLTTWIEERQAAG